MKYSRHFITLCFALLPLLALTPLKAADSHTLSEIIDKAGQQRMLSQRMAKAYLLKGIDQGSEKGEDQLVSSMHKFNKNFEVISAHASALQLGKQLGQVQMQWKMFQKELSMPHSSEQELKVIVQSDALLKKAHAYVQALQKISGKELSDVVGTSGKQRMLSQRIARNYLAYYRGLGEEEWLDRVYDDLAEYENALIYLKDASVNTKKTHTMLRKARSNFRFINLGFDGNLSFSHDRLMHIAVSSTEIMLFRMDELTKKYAEIERSADYQSTMASR